MQWAARVIYMSGPGDRNIRPIRGLEDPQALSQIRIPRAQAWIILWTVGRVRQ